MNANQTFCVKDNTGKIVHNSCTFNKDNAIKTADTLKKIDPNNFYGVFDVTADTFDILVYTA